MVQIPRELLEANPANYQPEEPVRRAHTNNPLSLFLSTLLPWFFFFNLFFKFILSLCYVDYYFYYHLKLLFLYLKLFYYLINNIITGK